MARVRRLRVPRWLVLALVVLLGWLALGPWFLVLCALPFAHWRVRDRLGAHWPDWRAGRTWRRLGIGTVAGALVAGVVVVVPDGWLPLPTGGGLAVTSGYDGRPVAARPIEGVTLPQHPYLAPNGRSAMHNDAASSDAYASAGPLGDEPDVDTAWFGVEECATLAFDSHDRMIGLCGAMGGPALHVIDPDRLRKLASVELPGRRPSDKRPWEDLCAGAYFYLDERDRAVLATTDRRIRAYTTADAAGEPDLTLDDEWDLRGAVAEDDCLLALMPGWDGRIWFVTLDGIVGTVAPASGRVRTLDLGEPVVNSFSVDEEAAYVVSDDALYRLVTGPGGVPREAWRHAYDRGADQKPGQLSRGSGTTPTLLGDDLVAITDNADPRMHVVLVDRATGQERCRAEVFEKFESATENSLVSLGDAVVVENNHGYSSPLSTMLGRAPTGGFARVEADDCSVTWTSERIAPTSVPKVSLETGLVYAITTRRSWWGVNAWYLTAISAHTGRHAFSVRTGTGTLSNNHYAAVTLGPDGSAYVATLGGLVRVRDDAR